ncbi:MAG: hypothetical protein GC184_07960 [Rhizobiales bacterium]|nr:hypothetical protein [Hyphomicrobiales bacterium]
MTAIFRAPARAQAFLWVSIALALSACGQVGARARDADGHVMPTLAELDPSSSLYASAINKAGKGECSNEVLDVITCFAYRGHGYEGAQTVLGQCDLRNGKNEEGVEWLKRAANAGWADAQLSLSRVYFEGTHVPKDISQAARWDLLYQRNPALISLGATPDRSVNQMISREISASEFEAANASLVNWRPSYWTPSGKLDARVEETCKVSNRSQVYRPVDIDKYTTPDPY